MPERITRLLIAVAIAAIVALVSDRVNAEFSILRASVASTVFYDLIIGPVAGLCAFAWASFLTNRHARQSSIEATREEGARRERARLAREIHDTFAQGFAGIVLSLEAAEDLLERSPEAKKLCDRALWIARESLSEARSLLRATPPARECKSLREAVAHLAESVTRGTELRLDCSIEEISGPLTPETEAELLGIVREALSNVVRHANASEARVTLHSHEDQIQLCVEDNGRGFTSGDSRIAQGFGLTSMRDRARNLGGLLWIYSRQGQGTQVVAFFPASGEGSSEPCRNTIASASSSPTTTRWSAKVSSRS